MVFKISEILILYIIKSIWIYFFTIWSFKSTLVSLFRTKKLHTHNSSWCLPSTLVSVRFSFAKQEVANSVISTIDQMGYKMLWRKCNLNQHSRFSWSWAKLVFPVCCFFKSSISILRRFRTSSKFLFPSSLISERN